MSQLFSDDQQPNAQFPQQGELDEDSTKPSLSQPAANKLPKREAIKHLLIGSPKTVTATIHNLQMIGYANVGDWSPLQTTNNPDEVMSILRRYIVVQ